MTNQGKEILTNAYEVSNLYFRFLHLGYYFDTYAKKHYLVNRVPSNIDITMEFAGAEGYKMDGNFIKSMLQDIYDHPQAESVFSYLTLFNALRGIIGAIREAFGESKEEKRSSGQKEIRKLFVSDLFDGDEDKFNEFDGIVRFIRNVLSHNITDRIALQNTDFDGQKTHWLKRRTESAMCFKYSYNKPHAPMKNDGYVAACDICINWQDVNEGVLFTDVVSTFQCFMLAEYCFNSLHFLNDKYK